MMNVAIKKPKIFLDFQEKTPANIQQAIDTLKEIACAIEPKKRAVKNKKNKY